MTRYTFKTTITVVVNMADEGEESSEGEVTNYSAPEAQAESAREWAEQAMPLDGDYCEPWVTIDKPTLELVKVEPMAPHSCEGPWFNCPDCRASNHYGFKGNFR